MNKRFFRMMLIALSVLVVLWVFGQFFTPYLMRIYNYLVYHTVDMSQGLLCTIFVFLTTMLIALGIPLVGPLALIGGRLMGTLIGTGITLSGVTLGSLLYIVGVRYFFKGYLDKKSFFMIPALSHKVKQYGYKYLLLLHLLMGIPLIVINTVAVTEHVPLIVVCIITILGSFPLVLAYSYAGSTVGQISSFSDVFSSRVTWALFIIGIMVLLIPFFMTRLTQRRIYPDE